MRLMYLIPKEASMRLMYLSYLRVYRAICLPVYIPQGVPGYMPPYRAQQWCTCLPTVLNSGVYASLLALG